MKGIVKRLVRSSPVLGNLAFSYLTKKRVARARAFMDENYLYPDDRASILDDFRYSIAHHNRGILQVLNIEEAVRAVVARGVEGAFVETGTWTGGASAYALRSFLRNEQSTDRRAYWGFDSFEGMPEPTSEDGDYAVKWMYGKKPVDPFTLSGALVGSGVNCAEYAQCLAYLEATGYPRGKIHLVKGWFQDTLPQMRDEIGPICILRMDGDFYESTNVVLENLYDKVVPGGFVLIDDYGVFQGCKKAVNEFLSARDLRPHIHYVDHSIHFFVKPA